MITDLRLQQFRSYSDTSFELGPRVNIVVGPNASGKTNLLEAILVVAQGKSFRAKDAELIQFGKTWSRLDADTPGYQRTVKLEADDYLNKTFILDEQSFSRLSQQRTAPVVLFEPNHLLLLSGSPELRRSFLDDLGEKLSPGFGASRRHYKRVLAQRNALLKKNPADLANQLFVWNIRLSELGGKIAIERRRLIDEFNKLGSSIYGKLAGKKSGVEIKYESPFPAENYESAFLKKLEQSVDLDVLRGFTGSGPHREDITVRLDGHLAQESASRGEIRTLVLTLKMMELQLLESAHNQKPMLLLDDVFSELDGKRRQALTKLIKDHQTFITTTDADMVVRHFTDNTIIPVASLSNHQGRAKK